VEGSSNGLILLLPVTGLEIMWKAVKDLRLIGVLLDVGTKQYKSEGRSSLLETIKLVPNKR
jgi:hypothetical protein